jgi:hypothetical protein
MIDLVYLLDQRLTVADSAEIYRFVLTILDLFKVYSIPKAPSLSSITDPFTGNHEEGYTYNINDALVDLGLNTISFRAKFNQEVSNHEFHESSAAGPNGHAL